MSGHNFPKLRLLRCPKFSQIFFSSSFRWVLPCGFRLGFAAPEAGHRCTWQLSPATTPWPSGSWRLRQPWMRRAIRAVASEEDLGGNLLRDGIRLWREVDEDVDGLSVWWILFSQLIGKFAKTFAPMFGVVFLWSPGFVLLEIGFVGRFFFFRRGFLFGNRLGLTIQKLFFSLPRVRSNETSVFHNLKNGDRGLSFVFKSYKVLVLQAYRNPKSVLELLEFPFWCELMWQRHLCRSHDSNQRFLISLASLAMFGLSHEIQRPKKRAKGIAFKFCGDSNRSFLFLSLLVQLCSASYMKYQEQRNTTRVIYFKIMWCSNHGRIYLLQNWGMMGMLTFIQVHLDCQHGWHGFDKTPKATVFSTNSMSSRHLKHTQCPGGLWVATISKTLTFEVTKIFLELFSPSFRWVLPAAWPRVRGSRGCTPLHYAANKGHDSVVARLLEAEAAVDVQNKDSRGLGGGFGEGNLLRHGIPLWGEVDEDVDGSSYSYLCLSKVIRW